MSCSSRCRAAIRSSSSRPASSSRATSATAPATRSTRPACSALDSATRAASAAMPSRRSASRRCKSASRSSASRCSASSAAIEAAASCCRASMACRSSLACRASNAITSERRAWRSPASATRDSCASWRDQHLLVLMLLVLQRRHGDVGGSQRHLQPRHACRSRRQQPAVGGDPRPEIANLPPRRQDAARLDARAARHQVTAANEIALGRRHRHVVLAGERHRPREACRPRRRHAAADARRRRADPRRARRRPPGSHPRRATRRMRPRRPRRRPVPRSRSGPRRRRGRATGPAAACSCRSTTTYCSSSPRLASTARS